ncbi:hypothetical protein EPUS_07145 [Endocarpon pusillum Z07020]|uniref:T6SS Phospholipase effector Tle1-like catalytic domain-containing protein n=1 Tax=Endocarpon pusillum (strain Z07020 / HMAS-L-300199) TaxID=1263415 RepID=U1FV90_ENDPU|nr:uncharacterized protein EPUS_07145 [Endocarpon pusillum Z07020]ERF68727.1 hypothetical protein EPUS_07145 [Endocarpon pusillum Z07020]
MNDLNRRPKTFVLCFDGTGNKFSGTDEDSNILKIYRMLDRSDDQLFTYYQPGIGTYISSGDLDHTSITDRIGSWYSKAKDSAIGTSFADHVMGGYKFLMRYYNPGDDIYMFGFSRGSYIARFLSEMVDHVGLLSAGNEEMARFAWKTFSKWQSRRGGSGAENKKEEKELYEFMSNFRETFSRPVKRIRFLGLFDTVNSVPRFENAWMQRSKFPYTARSSAKVIRHAVAINERRAKFRQDLISGAKLSEEKHHHHFWPHRTYGGVTLTHTDTGERSQNETSDTPQMKPQTTAEPEAQVPYITVDAASPPLEPSARPPVKSQDSHHSRLSLAQPVMNPSLEDIRGRNFSIAGPIDTQSLEGLRDHSQASYRSHRASQQRQFSGQNKKQHIEEVWFAVWMVHAASMAGLEFDRYKMAKLNCCPDDLDDDGDEDHEKKHKHFHDAIRESGCRGFMHDCLQFGGGLPRMSVLTWMLMEYLPFRRMDLRPDGSWKPIRWPLPAGETRDIPDDAKIHNSVIKRMQEDENYRPGNLIIGGGGRGVKKAGKEYGIGQWKVSGHEGDPIREVYVRMKPTNGKTE